MMHEEDSNACLLIMPTYETRTIASILPGRKNPHQLPAGGTVNSVTVIQQVSGAFIAIEGQRYADTLATKVHIQGFHEAQCIKHIWYG